MKKKYGMIVTTLLVSLFAVATATDASAQTCYRSTECEGAQICMDLQCVTPSIALSECEGLKGCDWLEECDQGYCKPIGVSCSNEYGQCSIDSNNSSCSCLSGDSMEGAGDYDGEGTPEVIADEVLYEMCTEAVEMMCEAPPDVEEFCAPDQITQCEAILTQIYTLEETCESDDTVVDETDIPDDYKQDTSYEDMDEPPPPASAQIQEGFSPWEIVDCCEYLQEIEEEEEEESESEMLDCIMALEPDDCEGMEACYDAYDIVSDGITKDEDPGDINLESDNNGDDVGGEKSDQYLDTENKDDNKDTEEADAGEKDSDSTDTSSSKSDSGCSFVPFSNTIGAFNLIKVLL